MMIFLALVTRFKNGIALLLDASRILQDEQCTRAPNRVQTQINCSDVGADESLLISRDRKCMFPNGDCDFLQCF